MTGKKVVHWLAISLDDQGQCVSHVVFEKRQHVIHFAEVGVFGSIVDIDDVDEQ